MAKHSSTRLSPTVELTLTRKQAEMLLDVLENYSDCGPKNEGWQSEELQDLRLAVEEAFYE